MDLWHHQMRILIQKRALEPHRIHVEDDGNVLRRGSLPEDGVDVVGKLPC